MLTISDEQQYGCRVYGMSQAIRGMRNPLNSWHLSDSTEQSDGSCVVGRNDYNLMLRLASAGPDHRKFMRMIAVYIDITAPLYWWKEFDTYKVGTVANSCSTMHKIAAKRFTIDDFSHEHILHETFTGLVNPTALLNGIVDALNQNRELYLQTKDKKFWWQLIQLLPSSYNQKRTVMMNYEVLANIYTYRRNHKLDEWRTFCAWIETLPYFDLIRMAAGKGKETDNQETDNQETDNQETDQASYMSTEINPTHVLSDSMIEKMQNELAQRLMHHHISILPTCPPTAGAKRLKSNKIGGNNG